MNEVYLIWAGEFCDTDVEAVFSTREKADEYLDAFKKANLEDFVEDKVGRSFRSVELSSGRFMMWTVEMVDYKTYDD